MTQKSWRQNLHGRTTQKQTYCNDAFSSVQSIMQCLMTFNIWIDSPSVSLQLKVRNIVTRNILIDSPSVKVKSVPLNILIDSPSVKVKSSIHCDT